MTLAQFISNPPTGVNGLAVSYDGLAEDIGQCEQLVCVYWRAVFGFNCPPVAVAKDLWTNPTVLGSFQQIPVGQAQPGDVGVFGASSLIDSPDDGHTDIYLGETAAGWTGFDSNWGGVTNAKGQPIAHQVEHTNVDVLGFLRFKGEDVMTQDEVKLIINAVTHQTARQADLDAWTTLPWTQYVDEALGAQPWLTQNEIVLDAYPKLVAQVAQLQQELGENGSDNTTQILADMQAVINKYEVKS